VFWWSEVVEGVWQFIVSGLVRRGLVSVRIITPWQVVLPGFQDAFQGLQWEMVQSKGHSYKIEVGISSFYSAFS
jgi:hypothetical protein